MTDRVFTLLMDALFVALVAAIGFLSGRGIWRMPMFLGGLILGAVIGVFAMGLMQMAKKGE